MKRLVIGGAIAAIIAGGAGASFAGEGGGFGFNGNNDYGLCTAWTHNGHAGPFADLQPPADYSGSIDQYCAEVLAGDGSPGNSEHGHGGH